MFYLACEQLLLQILKADPKCRGHCMQKSQLFPLQLNNIEIQLKIPTTNHCSYNLGQGEDKQQQYHCREQLSQSQYYLMWAKVVIQFIPLRYRLALTKNKFSCQQKRSVWPKQELVFLTSNKSTFLQQEKSSLSSAILYPRADIAVGAAILVLTVLSSVNASIYMCMYSLIYIYTSSLIIPTLCGKTGEEC